MTDAERDRMNKRISEMHARLNHVEETLQHAIVFMMKQQKIIEGLRGDNQ